MIRTDPIKTHGARARRGGWRGQIKRFLAAPGPRALVTVAAFAALVGAAPWRSTSDDVFCVIAFGDSITAGTGLPAPQGFVSVLEARLRADGYAARVINAGVPGDTSGQGAARLGSALKAKADMAIVEFGANDLFKRVDLQVLRENLETIVAAFRAGGTRVLNWSTPSRPTALTEITYSTSSDCTTGAGDPEYISAEIAVSCLEGGGYNVR